MMKYTLLIILSFFLINCKKINDNIYIKKIERLEKNNEVNIFIQNDTEKNYYIIEPQCELYDGKNYLYSYSNSRNHNHFPIVDSIVKDVYNFVDDSAGIKKPLKIVFLKAHSIKKLNFGFKSKIKEYKETNFVFTFNIPNRKLLLLNAKLKPVKLDSNYIFYSNEIK